MSRHALNLRKHARSVKGSKKWCSGRILYFHKFNMPGDNWNICWNRTLGFVGRQQLLEVKPFKLLNKDNTLSNNMPSDRENAHTARQQMSALMQLDLFGLEQTNWHDDTAIQKEKPVRTNRRRAALEFTDHDSDKWNTFSLIWAWKAPDYLSLPPIPP